MHASLEFRLNKRMYTFLCPHTKFSPIKIFGNSFPNSIQSILCFWSHKKGVSFAQREFILRHQLVVVGKCVFEVLTARLVISSECLKDCLNHKRIGTCQPGLLAPMGLPGYSLLSNHKLRSAVASYYTGYSRPKFSKCRRLIKSCRSLFTCMQSWRA
jgi:hypothetical protein